MLMTVGRRLIVLFALVMMALPASATRTLAAEPVRIFAAATLKDALDAVAAAAQAATHVPVTLVYGPSPAS